MSLLIPAVAWVGSRLVHPAAPFLPTNIRDPTLDLITYIFRYTEWEHREDVHHRR